MGGAGLKAWFTLSTGLAFLLLAGLLASSTAGSLSAGATFSGRDGRIAYTSDGGGAPQLYLMRADGSHRVRLVRSSQAAAPDWSPDGKRIAFGAVRRAGQGISSVKVGGGNLRRVTRHSTNVYDGDPHWSADGRKLVFSRASRSTAKPSLYVVGAKGGRPRRIATDATTPAYSPNGRLIAFAAGPGPAHLTIMRVSDKGRRRLTRGPGG